MSVSPWRQPSPDSQHQESAEELYENAPCGYLSTTLEGQIIRINKTLVEWLGYPREVLLGGRSFSSLLTIGGRIYHETHFAPLLQMHGEVREVALDLVCANSRVLPALISAVQKLDETGTAILNRITIFDATERRAYENELLSMRERAEDAARELLLVNQELARSNEALLHANQELGQFAYAASHDLREPLRSITMLTEMLQHRQASLLDAESRKLMKGIVDGGTRMRILINDLLTFAQTPHLVIRRVSLEETLRVVLANLAGAIRDSQAVITQDVPLEVPADAARLAQVLENLIGNAIKYRRPGVSPVVHISVSRQENQFWLVEIRDNGIGFDADHNELIFGVFKRLHGREIPGTGIGLAICRKIVESHGGRIWAESVPGEGSRFFFTIPDSPDGGPTGSTAPDTGS